jgi:hypothetical protein
MCGGKGDKPSKNLIPLFAFDEKNRYTTSLLNLRK